MNDLTRCAWLNKEEIYIKYHDEEWGEPVKDDEKQFEFLILETFQAGLSWITILKKRENFREAFDHFDYKKIANYNEKKVEELLQNAGIIRNKLKIKATVTNAQCFMEVQKEFGSFSNYIWGFVNHTPKVNHWKTIKEAPATDETSDALSKDMKKRGFKFVGSTVMYAHLQATGLINDHTTDCFKYRK